MTFQQVQDNPGDEDKDKNEEEITKRSA